jgi:uncharacterized membrane protein YqjE
LSLPLTPHRFSPLLLALLGLLLVLLPLALLGPHSYFTIDDSLDSDVSVYYLLHRFRVGLDYASSTVVPSVMNGLPRNCLRPGLHLTMASFALLPTWAAYISNQTLVRLAGLLGMYALLVGPLRLHHRRGLAAALALAWATLPNYTIFGASVLGQPALLLAFLSLRQGPARWWQGLIIVLFAGWSTFAFVGPFALVALGSLLLWDWWHTKRLNRRLVAGMALLMLAYVVVEWPIFYSLLVAKQFVPHRVEFDLRQLSPLGWQAGVRSTIQYFLFGQYHASRFLRVSALLAVAVAVLQVPAGQRGAVLRRFAPWLLVLAGLAVIGGFYPQAVAWAKAHWPAVSVFNAGRFYFLAPLLYFLLLALAARELSRRWQVVVVGLQLLIGLAMNGEFVNNLRALAGHTRPHDPSYLAYEAPTLFQEIQATIQQQTGLVPSQYRVACLGLAPGVAQLNDFYTLDSYQNYYPLSYKHQFRPIIAGELAKSPEIRRYFDAWGSRCYLFSAELGRDFQVGAYQQRIVQDFAFDAAAFQALGGRYVLSAARLATPDRSGLRLVRAFEQPDAYWRIWLYEVKT